MSLQRIESEETDGPEHSSSNDLRESIPVIREATTQEHENLSAQECQEAPTPYPEASDIPNDQKDVDDDNVTQNHPTLSTRKTSQKRKQRALFPVDFDTSSMVKDTAVAKGEVTVAIRLDGDESTKGKLLSASIIPRNKTSRKTTKARQNPTKPLVMSEKITEANRETFYRHFEELKVFKQTNGHCEVPINLPLGKWCHEVRLAYAIFLQRQREGNPESKCGRMRFFKDYEDVLKKVGFRFERDTAPRIRNEIRGNADNVPDLSTKDEKKSRRKRSTTKKKNQQSRDGNCQNATIKEQKVDIDESIHDIEKLPELPQIPSFPNTGKCNWAFDDTQRVVLANFKVGSTKPEMTAEDESFLLKMMERTDIAVVSEGLLSNFDEFALNFDFLEGRAGDKMHHRFRVFEKEHVTEEYVANKRIGLEKKQMDGNSPTVQHYVEQDGDLSMKISDYARYVRKFKELQLNPNSNPNFSYTTRDGTTKDFDVTKHSIYLIDLDLQKYLPESHRNFLSNFLATDFLPGGKYCMMGSVNPEGRPFMGPNLYISPPGGFTHFHQDGHGTVDSGHFCCMGYNEVVMLTRMDEAHKKHALHILTCNDRRVGRRLRYDALYGLPHHDGEKPSWPDNIAIETCKEHNYYPCVFILKPGQLLHINKGRLHAFRKMSRSPLDQNDCHYKLRREIVNLNSITDERWCMSVAWDWMFLGDSIKGINEEVISTLECAQLLQLEGKQSLAIPQLCLIELAKYHLTQHRYLQRKNVNLHQETQSLKILRGILLGVKRVLAEQIQCFNHRHEEREELGEYEKLIIRNTPDALDDPQHVTVDPFGNDFFCMLCHKELGNTYLHCEGCEKLLSKDFNICISCHNIKAQRHQNFQMHPLFPLAIGSGRRSDYNHRPSHSNYKRSCGCHYGPRCKNCGYMVCCSCICHKTYSLRSRFYNGKDMEELLQKIQNCIMESNTYEGVPVYPTVTEDYNTETSESPEDDRTMHPIIQQEEECLEHDEPSQTSMILEQSGVSYAHSSPVREYFDSAIKRESDDLLD